MPDDLMAQRKIWEAEHKRHKLWRWRMSLALAASCVAIVAFIVGVLTPGASQTALIALIVAASIALPVSLIGTIAFGASEFASQRQLTRLDQQLSARNDTPTT